MQQVTFSNDSGGQLALPAYNEVYIWNVLSDLRPCLSDKETQLSKRIKHQVAKVNFVRGRSAVRRILAAFLKREPDFFQISYAPGGKPRLVLEEGIFFNVSHAGSTVVVGFSGAEIGVDIEGTTRQVDFEAIAARYFHAAEREVIAAAGECGRDEFFRIWTSKEAMLKLSGTGLAGGLAEAEVGIGGRGKLGEREVWLRHFRFGEICGAVAGFSPFEVKGWFDL